jgi:hypothetical protein
MQFIHVHVLLSKFNLNFIRDKIDINLSFAKIWIKTGYNLEFNFISISSRFFLQKLTLSRFHPNFICIIFRYNNYQMRTIISRGLYLFYPFFTAAAAYTAERPLFLDYLIPSVVASIIFKRNCTLNKQ